MRDLTEIYTATLKAPINGKTYTVPAPSGAVGFALRHELTTDANAVDNLEWMNRLFGGDPLPDTRIPTGGLWETLWEDGVEADYALHLGVTAIAFYGYGPEVAEKFWESLGKPVPQKEPEMTETTGS